MNLYFSQECVRLEKSRDGCPKIVNLGGESFLPPTLSVRRDDAELLCARITASRQDLFYEKKKNNACVDSSGFIPSLASRGN